MSLSPLEPAYSVPVLDFEKPVAELERKIKDMKDFASAENFEFKEEIKRLEYKLEKLKNEIYGKITPWNRVQIARHPRRPTTLDLVGSLFTDWVEIHGDRGFADDKAIVAGLAKLRGRSVCVIGHQKGKDVKDNIRRNFGMPNPEGYRKALRVMKMAEKFHRPIITFIDTPGAFPGIGAEERGQAEAIARNLKEMSHLRVPIVVVIIGEGASGGALGIGVGDRTLMFENAWYGVISPEGCAAILFTDRGKAPDMAEAMQITADRLKELGLIDEIVPEPQGGAHRNPAQAAEALGEALSESLTTLASLSPEILVENRLQKYFKMGRVKE